MVFSWRFSGCHETLNETLNKMLSSVRAAKRMEPCRRRGDLFHFKSRSESVSMQCKVQHNACSSALSSLSSRLERIPAGSSVPDSSKSGVSGYCCTARAGCRNAAEKNHVHEFHNEVIGNIPSNSEAEIVLPHETINMYMVRAMVLNCSNKTFYTILDSIDNCISI